MGTYADGAVCTNEMVIPCRELWLLSQSACMYMCLQDWCLVGAVWWERCACPQDSGST